MTSRVNGKKKAKRKNSVKKKKKKKRYKETENSVTGKKFSLP